ncbi:MAG TPA: SRPBCC family protein [Acidobacteriaceae bacterium]
MRAAVTEIGRAQLVGDREMAITRIFDAPRETVFDAWIDSQAIGQWWGPRGFSTTTHSMEMRTGGVWQYTMHGPDGTNYPNEIRYESVEIPERIIYTTSGGREDDDIHTHRVIVEFRDKGGKTEVSLRMIFPSAAERDEIVKVYGALKGLNETMDRLGEYL